MTFLQIARIAENENRATLAFESYLAAMLNNEKLELDDYVNFSFLAFLIQDCGFIKEHEVPQSIIDVSWNWIFDALKECEYIFGKTVLVEFIRKFYKSILEVVCIESSEWEYFSSLGIKEAALYLEKEKVNNEFTSDLWPSNTFRTRYFCSLLVNV